MDRSTYQITGTRRGKAKTIRITAYGYGDAIQQASSRPHFMVVVTVEKIA